MKTDDIEKDLKLNFMDFLENEIANLIRKNIILQ